MATSGSVNFTLTAGQVIDKAFGKVGVKSAEQALQASEMQDGLDALNLLLKLMQAQGLHLWTREEGVLFLDAGKTDYLVGPSGDKATTLDDFEGTTTTAAEAALATVIDVEDSTGMTAADIVGIQLDDGTRHWTTIVSVDSSIQITITTGIPSGAALGNTVFTYTNIIERPLRVTSFRRKTFAADNEIPVNQWSRSEYFNQTNKESQGTVVNAYYSPLLTNGRVYVWQTASSVNDYVRLSFQRAIEDVDAKTDNLDIPVEWLEPIIYGVAARLVDDYNIAPEKGDRLILKAQAMLDEVLGWDQEYESINLQPDFN
tara:strand:+ start:25062 stop:26006 length:945 start_codon:yes stop_codon:yes gene_type:complete